MNVQDMKIKSDFTVFIGENGCGKSEILSQLSRIYASNGQDVIAIAHCIHDKFDEQLCKKKNFDFLGARLGSEMTKVALREVIKAFSKKNESNSILSQVFEYVGYEPSIGISIEFNDFSLDSLPTRLSKSKSSIIRHSDVVGLIRSYNLTHGSDNLIWFDFNYRDYSTFTNINYNELIRFEKELVDVGVIKEIRYFLRKGGEVLNIEKASSGELYQIANISYIASKIKKNSVIFIDEPENSLHPKWQKEYIGKLFNFFSLYYPRFVLATHSPLILSSLNLNHDDADYSRGLDCSIYKVEKFKVEGLSHSEKNVENILWNVFGVITPENNFLSNFLVELINELNERNINLDYTLNHIDNLYENATDPRQRSVIKEVRKIALNLGSGRL